MMSCSSPWILCALMSFFLSHFPQFFLEWPKGTLLSLKFPQGLSLSLQSTQPGLFLDVIFISDLLAFLASIIRTFGVNGI